MNPPIIFVHYGASPYLQRSLRAAALSNIDRKIFFLGDSTNRRFAKGYAEFVDFHNLESASISEFDRDFQVIQGEKHRFNKIGSTEKWLNFVFRRWFLISRFLELENIDSFWTFDSDTLILSPLGPRQHRFSGYDATTQCRDCCLNGYISSRQLPEQYTKYILSLFRDRDYLESQRERLKHQAGLAFNEMDAFCEFRRRVGLQTFHAAQPLQGEFFDDALAYDHNFEASPLKIAGRITVKRLWSDPDGGLYAKHLASGEFVRMLTCNLSWLPDYVGKILAQFCLTRQQDSSIKFPNKADLKEVNLSQPLSDKVTTAIKKSFHNVRRSLDLCHPKRVD